MFSHNGANGPESKTMHMFRPVCQVAALGAKSVVSDSILLIKPECAIPAANNRCKFGE